jgi:hypothetical protein
MNKKNLKEVGVDHNKRWRNKYLKGTRSSDCHDVGTAVGVAVAVAVVVGDV